MSESLLRKDLVPQLTPGAAPGANATHRYRVAAEALWGLLDDIDTADDMAKGDDALYRAQVRTLAAGRLDYARSLDGGDHLTWSWQQNDPASCWHKVHGSEPKPEPKPLDIESLPPASVEEIKYDG